MAQGRGGRARRARGTADGDRTMDAIRRALRTIGEQLGRMTVVHRLLIGSLGVIVVLVLVLVGQMSGGTSVVALRGFSAGGDAEVVAALRAANIGAEAGPSGVTVPARDQHEALAVLAQAGLMDGDTRNGFADLLSMQDWKLSREQNRQQYIIALQNEMARVLREFRGVRSASVIIDAPEQRTLNAPRQRPSASVTILGPSEGLSQQTVDAAAALVAGGLSGLEKDRVEVIDAAVGRSRRATPADQVGGGDYMERRASAEVRLRAKLEEVLWYIPGVVVAVTADVDVTRVSQATTRHLPEGDGTVQLAASESLSTISESGSSRSAEAGVRANQGLDLNRGGGTGRTYSQEESDTTFTAAVGVERREVVDPRGLPTFLTASVSVPEGFVAGLVGEGAEAGAVASRFEAERRTIEELVRPHLKARGADGGMIEGELRVAMIPVSGAAVASAGGGGLLGGLFGGGGGVASIGSGGALDTVLVGATAVVAMGLMVMMIRRSGKKLELPTAEELVGIPPALQRVNDIVGEVGEGDTAMTGIEIGEDKVQRSTMLTQVTEMINTDPDKAATLVRRWVTMEE